MKIKEQILSLDKERYVYIDKWQESYDEESGKYLDNESENIIDNLRKEIIKLLCYNKEELEFEFIFEQLTRLGNAPNLLYDDNGHFAIIDDGFQSVVTGDPVDWEGTFFVEKEFWFDDIRSALYNYMTRE